MAKTFGIVVAAILIVSSAALAQEAETRQDRHPFRSAFVSSLLDPTSVVPPVLFKKWTDDDWRKSQKLFGAGMVEANPLFTVSGKPNDTPISYAAGRRKINLQTMQVAAMTYGIDLSLRSLDNLAQRQDPQNRRALKWGFFAARMATKAYLVHKLANPHRVQAGKNEQMALELGLR